MKQNLTQEKIKDVLYAVGTIAIFAAIGVMLALGI
jgi:hypothetical protein